MPWDGASLNHCPYLSYAQLPIICPIKEGTGLYPAGKVSWHPQKSNSGWMSKVMFSVHQPVMSTLSLDDHPWGPLLRGISSRNWSTARARNPVPSLRCLKTVTTYLPRHFSSFSHFPMRRWRSLVMLGTFSLRCPSLSSINLNSLKMLSPSWKQYSLWGLTSSGHRETLNHTYTHLLMLN